MSTIDEKYLGDRIKALEENITDTVAEGSTAVPTAGAVYNAIQGGAIRYVVPNAVQTVNDDIFCSPSGNSASTPALATIEVYNNSFIFTTTGTLYIWIKNSAFGIDETKSARSEFLSKFILNILQCAWADNVCCLQSINYSTAYTGYTVVEIRRVQFGVITLMLQ